MPLRDLQITQVGATQSADRVSICRLAAIQIAQHNLQITQTDRLHGIYKLPIKIYHWNGHGDTTLASRIGYTSYLSSSYYNLLDLSIC